MNICVIAPHKGIYSETFVRAHVDMLAGKTSFLYGELFPTHTADDKPLLPQPSTLERVRRIFLNRLFGVRFDPDLLRQEAFEKYLVDKKIDVVLAEFGRAKKEKTTFYAKPGKKSIFI